METERIWVSAHSGGHGQKAFGSGSFGVRRKRQTDGVELVEFSIGRGHGVSGPKATAWVALSLARAHEIACLLAHLVHAEFPCKGEGPTGSTRHNASMSLSFSVNADLCTVLNDREGLRERILKKAGEEFDKLTQNKEEEV